MAGPSSPTEPSCPSRAGDAGVTLVEVLVVVVLVGVAAGAVALGLGSAGPGPDLGVEARLLAARMARASEEAVLTGRAAAIVWTEDAYRFVAEEDGGWTPHPVPLLAEERTLPGGVRLAGASGAFVVTAAALPAGPEPLSLSLEGRDAKATVTWDGAAARVEEAPP